MAAQPLSPWAERFNELLDQTDIYHEILAKDSHRHSGIAVEFPRRDPKFYNDPLHGAEANTQPQNGIEIDRLFISELFQRQGFHGSTTWELTALNRFLWVSNQYGILTGGHLTDDNPDVAQAAYRNKLIKIDETRWFEFLQKHRWYDLIEDSPVPTRAGSWSVDNPTLWATLRASIELADRILKTLILERHSALETILFGRILYWRNIPSMADNRPFEDALVLLSREMEVELAASNNLDLWQSEFSMLPEEQKTIEMVIILKSLCPYLVFWKEVEALTQRQFWSFAPSLEAGEAWGQSLSTRDYNLGFVNSELLRHLCSGELTMAETFMLQFQLMIVLIRELMHSLIAARYHLEGSPEGLEEPFIDFDAVSEIGAAVESRIWGGRFVIHPVANSVPLSTALVHWPSVYSYGIRNPAHAAFQDGAPVTIERYPALYLAKFFVEEFWQNPSQPRKSDRHFGRKGLFQSSTALSNGIIKTWNEMTVNETNSDEWDQFDGAVVGAWRENQYVFWRDREVWYDNEYTRWASTPWGMGLLPRQQVDSFGAHFAERDEFASYRSPAMLVIGYLNEPGMLNWRDRNEFFTNLPIGGERDSKWVYFTIALPIRTTEQQRTGGEASMRLFIYKPSADCAAVVGAGLDAPPTVELTEPERVDPLWSRREPSVLYNPFNFRHLREEPSQIGYLRLVIDILDYVQEIQAIVSGPWYWEISRCTRDLLSQRWALMAEHPHDHHLQWAKSWDFHVPDYDPYNLGWMEWNYLDSQWHHLPNASSREESPQYSDFDPSDQDYAHDDTDIPGHPPSDTTMPDASTGGSNSPHGLPSPIDSSLSSSSSSSSSSSEVTIIDNFRR
ncbi:hypothetical protein GGR51DRAFT_572261 [Nemania sp. FL0031]|nr:hypothetical protein GGR51DRAFT_572261 [Nemania sp. FL0031]